VHGTGSNTQRKWLPTKNGTEKRIETTGRRPKGATGKDIQTAWRRPKGAMMRLVEKGTPQTNTVRIEDNIMQRKEKEPKRK